MTKKKTPTKKTTPRQREVLHPEVLPAEEAAQRASKEALKDAEQQEPDEDSEWDPDQDAEAEASSHSLTPARARTHPEVLDAEVETSLEDEDDLGLESPGARAISPTDPLRRYLEEVRRYPLLTPEKELELALRMVRDGDVNAAKALVSANLRLVVKIAFEYKSLYTNVMDLIQEGNVGLMKAVSKYDPSKGARLGYYASWWIRSYILKYLLDNFRLVKIGTTQAQKKLFYHLMREKERMEAQGLIASPKLLADKLNVRERDVVEMEARLGGQGAELRLDAPLGEEADGGKPTSHLDLLADGQESADERLARNELVDLLKKRLPEFEKTLNEKERRLLHERLLNDEPHTLQEVADNYGLTRERARQIEAKVIFKLKEFLSL